MMKSNFSLLSGLLERNSSVIYLFHDHAGRFYRIHITIYRGKICSWKWFSCLCFSLILGIYSDKFGLSLYKNATSRWFSILINLIAIYLFASRTYWVMLFLFIIIFSLKTMRKDKLLFFILIFAVVSFCLLSG